MSVSMLCSMAGGIAFFLYGMWILRTHLEEAAGERMRRVLAGMTATPLRGLSAGIAVTAALQSSSAAMVILVGLVSANLLSLRQAAWLVFGANIGTTVTGQLLAFDLRALAPALAFCGIVLLLCGRGGWKRSGGCIGGLGLLFLGMGQMGAAMVPLGQQEGFRQVLTKCEQPFAGILAGSIFAAIIQSSSAAVGSLQALAGDGLLTLSQAMYQVFGQNIGTCATAFLALTGLKEGAGRKGEAEWEWSVAGRQAAARVALFHLLVNVIGTVFFTSFCQIFPAQRWVVALSPDDVPRQIANVHTFFNVGTMLMLAPFAERLAGWVEAVGSAPRRPKRGARGK